MVNIHAKFEVSSLNRSRDKEGVLNSKSRSRDPSHTPFDLLLNFYR